MCTICGRSWIFLRHDAYKHKRAHSRPRDDENSLLLLFDFEYQQHQLFHSVFHSLMPLTSPKRRQHYHHSTTTLPTNHLRIHLACIKDYRISLLFIFGLFLSSPAHTHTRARVRACTPHTCFRERGKADGRDEKIIEIKNVETNEPQRTRRNEKERGTMDECEQTE